jgi:hypothetical protein
VVEALATALIAASDPNPLVVGLIAGVFGGGLLSGIAAYMRGRTGAQLDVAGTAKILLDELRIERDEARTERDRLEARADELENALAECRREHVMQVAQLIEHYERALGRRDEPS